MESSNYVSIWSNERTKQGDDRGNVVTPVQNSLSDGLTRIRFFSD